MYPITCVSGFWNVTNKHQSAFDTWLQHTLKINCPYVLFSKEETQDTLRNCRGDYPTIYKKREIPDFVTYKYKENIQTHPVHVPSKEVQMIWNEKLFMIREVERENPFDSEWFLWMDAGIFLYRNHLPPTIPFHTEKLSELPKNKLIFTSGDSPIFRPNSVKEGEYYHYVSGIFMIHKDFVEEFVSLYETYVEKLLSQKDWIYTDQVILTHMYKDHPEFFHNLGHGYGGVVSWLYR